MPFGHFLDPDEMLSELSEPLSDEDWNDVKEELNELNELNWLPNKELDTSSIDSMLGLLPDYSEIPNLDNIKFILERNNWIRETKLDTSGNNNIILIYENKTSLNKTNRKITLRYGKIEYLKYENGNLKVFNPEPDCISKNDLKDILEYQLKQLFLSKNNWINANEYELSPELLFCGCVSDGIRLKFAVVSEAYDSDLETYYEITKHREDTQKQKTINKLIQEQITDILFKISNEPFNTICFDIKPLNCVIKYKINEDTPIVKLIDWDGDWCNPIPSRFRGSYYNIGILSNILMANIFYTRIRINIFYEYFKSIEEFMKLNKDALKQLFCKFVVLDEDKNPTEKDMEKQGEKFGEEFRNSFEFFANFYTNNFEWKIQCNELFDKLFERCFIEQRDETVNIFYSHRGGKNKKHKKHKKTKKQKNKNKKQKNKNKKTKKQKTKQKH